MTRKKAVKLLMSVTLDGYRRTANDLMRAYHKKHPAATNEKILLDILYGICACALCDGSIDDAARAARLFITITHQSGGRNGKKMPLQGGIALERKA